MSWKPKPFRMKAKRYSFHQFKFPDLNLEEGLESYARFIFARLAFLKGSHCALLKNHKFLAKGDLTLLHVRQHAERETVLGLSLAQKSTGLTKAACAIFSHAYVVDAIGQGCRFVSAMVQDGIKGLVELCPDRRVRVWALFNEPMPVAEAVEQMKRMKEHAFISAAGEFFPKPDGEEAFLELPPYPDPDTGRWSLVLTLEDAERILDGFMYTHSVPDWDELLGDVQMEKRSAPHGQAKRGPEVAVVESGIEENMAPPETGVPGNDVQALENKGSRDEREGPLAEDPGVVLYLRGQAFPPSEQPAEEVGPPPAEPRRAGAEEPEFLQGSSEVPENRAAAEAPSSAPHSGAETGEPEAASGTARAQAYSLAPLSASIPGIVGRLLNPSRMAIPTPSQALNEALNGGWALQRLYLVAGGTGEGKTTFCAWTSDFAASRHIPVVFVSFQAPKETLSIYALARASQIDSARIERGLCSDRRNSEGEDLRKKLMNAGRQYFRTGDYLHVLEADCDTTVADVREAVMATRQHFGISESDPVLVVIDSVRELHPEVASEEKPKRARDRITHVLLQLKEVSQSENAAILITLDLPAATQERFGGFSADTREFETASSLCDTCFILESHTRLGGLSGEDLSLRRRQGSRLKDPLDRLLEDFGGHPVLAKRLQAIRKEFPALEESCSTYCRLVTLKNRGGKTDLQPLFRYHRAYHDFEPIPFAVAELLG